MQTNACPTCNGSNVIGGGTLPTVACSNRAFHPKIRFVVKLRGYERQRGSRFKREIALYVKSVSWGKGDEITKLTWTASKEEAVTVAKFMAEKMVAIFCGPRWRKFASMEAMEEK